MTVLTRWEPIRELANLQERMNRLFNESSALSSVRSRCRQVHLFRP